MEEKFRKTLDKTISELCLWVGEFLTAMVTMRGKSLSELNAYTYKQTTITNTTTTNNNNDSYSLYKIRAKYVNAKQNNRHQNIL